MSIHAYHFLLVKLFDVQQMQMFALLWYLLHIASMIQIYSMPGK